MSRQNNVRGLAEYEEVVHLAVSRVVRETNYSICQNNRKRSKYEKMHTYRKRLKCRKRSKLSVSSKSKGRLWSRMRSNSRKLVSSKKRAMSKVRHKSKIWSKSRKRSESRQISMSGKMSMSWKRCKPLKQSKSKNLFKVSKGAKIKNRYNQIPHLTQDTDGKVPNSQLDTTNESQEVSPFQAGDHIYTDAHKGIANKYRNNSKSKKGSVQLEEAEESGTWVKYISQSSQVLCGKSNIDEKEKTYPLLGTLVCLTRTIFTESFVHTRNTPFTCWISFAPVFSFINC